MKTKKGLRLMFAVFALWSSLTAGSAEIRNVTAKQRFPWNGNVDITYEVVGDLSEGLPEWNRPVLVLSATNRVAGTRYIAKVTALTGDIGATEGAHHVVWDLDAQGLRFKSDEVRFVVAYEEVEPMAYCVIDLSSGSNSSAYPVTYCDEPPLGGFDVDEYKTTKIVLKLLRPGAFKMSGSCDVTLTKPFYCGLFEVTQRQWELVANNPNVWGGSSGSYPAYNVNYGMIRGSSAGAGWPASSSVDGSSFLGKLRARTGIDFDLPTEAQWEYACRAGTTTTYSYGDSPNLSYMWYASNSGQKTHEVGTKLPNPWGLYDMHGNVAEWCLDWYVSDLAGGVDPKGPSSGKRRVSRGGNWDEPADYCASLFRCSYSNSLYDGSHFGFRIVRTLSNKVR